MFKRSQKTQENPTDTTRKLLQKYTPEEQAWILAFARARFEQAEAAMQEKREVFYEYYGYWPDF